MYGEALARVGVFMMALSVFIAAGSFFLYYVTGKRLKKKLEAEYGNRKR